VRGQGNRKGTYITRTPEIICCCCVVVVVVVVVIVVVVVVRSVRCTLDGFGTLENESLKSYCSFPPYIRSSALVTTPRRKRTVLTERQINCASVVVCILRGPNDILQYKAFTDLYTRFLCQNNVPTFPATKFKYADTIGR